MAEPVIWLEVVKVVATLGASGVAAWVAWRIGSSQRDIARQQAETAADQKRIAAAKLNLELFEERYAVFEVLRVFLFDTLIDPGQGGGPLHDMDFIKHIQKARFLFGDHIGDYMAEAADKRLELWRARKRQGDGGSDAMADAATIKILDGWFSAEMRACFNRFGPYLDFSNWKAEI